MASNAHRWGSINFDDLGGARSYRSSRIYGQSKLANILFTYELARRLEGTGVTVNCVHPGAVATGLGANNGALAKLLMPLIGLFMRSPEQGAATHTTWPRPPKSKVSAASTSSIASRRNPIRNRTIPPSRAGSGRSVPR